MRSIMARISESIFFRAAAIGIAPIFRLQNYHLSTPFISRDAADTSSMVFGYRLDHLQRHITMTEVITASNIAYNLLRLR
jgi:hypothetical protein